MKLGIQRCQSNFPVDKIAFSYHVMDSDFKVSSRITAICASARPVGAASP
jgi:hypothetical protein